MICVRSGRLATASAVARRAALGAAALAALVAGTRGTQDAVANGDTRTLAIIHEHTKESAQITFKRNGFYDQQALEQLNWLLRDWRTDQKIRMEPRLFDIVWEVYRSVGASEPVHVVSAYRAPETNAMLRRRSRAVSEFSQHMAGKAMDFFLPGVDMARVRAVGMKLQYGGVGFYPYSAHSFVHLDAGSVRAWPRMTRGQLMALFPDGKTVHLPTDNKPLPGYEEARAEVLARGGAVAGYAAYASAGETGGGKSLWARLFGGGDDEDAAYYQIPRGRNGAAGRANVAAYAPSYNSDDAGTRGVLAFAAPEPEPARAVSRARGSSPTQVAALQPETPATTSTLGALFGLGSSEAPAQAAPEAESDSAAPALSLSLLPPRRPDGLIDLGALADIPLPPSRPVELASLGPVPLPAAVSTQPASDDRAQLRALFAAAATSATPTPRVKVATARARTHDATPVGFVAEPGAGLAAGFSKKPDTEFGATRFTGPAVKALPTLR
jgi:uncharacterized protein YcbK (DUF882 family)